MLWPATVAGKKVKRTAFVIKVIKPSKKCKHETYLVETIDGEQFKPPVAQLTTKRGRRPAKYAALGKR